MLWPRGRVGPAPRRAPRCARRGAAGGRRGDADCGAKEGAQAGRRAAQGARREVNGLYCKPPVTFLPKDCFATPKRYSRRLLHPPSIARVTTRQRSPGFSGSESQAVLFHGAPEGRSKQVVCRVPPCGALSNVGCVRLGVRSLPCVLACVRAHMCVHACAFVRACVRACVRAMRAIRAMRACVRCVRACALLRDSWGRQKNSPQQ